MVDLNDEVELKGNRFGIVRYKGQLYGKNGIFYGIELTQGTGKHGGLFRGKRYFSCHRTKGVFVNKKQILCKFVPAIKSKSYANLNTKKRKKSKNSLTRSSSQEIGKGKFKLPRKTGPSYAKKSCNKSDWKPPDFMQEVLRDIECGDEFLGCNLSRHRGKFQAKTKYGKAGYLPHAKLKNKMWKADDWNAFLDGIKDATLRNEMEKQMIEWKEELNDEQNYLDNDEMKAMENKRILLEEEMKEMQYEKDKLAEEYEQKQEQQRHELAEERLFLKKEKERKMREQEEIQIQMKEEKLHITKLESKRKQLENVRRELEEEEKRLRLERENSNKELFEEKQKLEQEREQMENELNEQRKEIEEERQQILNKERKKLEKERKKQLEDDERERQQWEDRRIKIEQIKMQEKKERERRLKEENSSETSDDDRKREESPVFKGGYSSDHSNYSTSGKNSKSRKKRKKRRRKKRKRKEPKAPKKDYKIFFSVNLQTDENDENLISNTEELRFLLSELFDTKSERDVFEIKTRQKDNGFKIDFGIIIATSMHPADYIDTFDDLTNDGSFQETIKEGFELNKNPHVHIWEARYEKVDPKKQRKRKHYY